VDKENTTQYELFAKEGADFSTSEVVEGEKVQGLDSSWYKDLTAIP